MNRIKQFIWAITSSFKKIDEEPLNKYLNKLELEEFNKLSKAEKHHCIRVCKDSINKYKDNELIDIKRLAKITLLHDVGKNKEHTNIFEKSYIVILDKITKGKLKSHQKNKKIYIYYNHQIESINILKKIGGYDKDFIEAIKNHHNDKSINNIYLNILKKYDDKN